MEIDQYLNPPRVAIVEIAGQIGARLAPRDVTRLLNSIRTNPRYPAVVLDIDSPGGGAAASESIYLAVKRLAAEKPVTAAIRGVGASGGYMIACAANPIYALPTSIVGSIGVIWMMPLVAEALERIGVKMRTQTSGEYKDMGSLFRESTPEEEAKLRGLLDGVYERFVDIVDDGRPSLERARVAELASGEVHTGQAAHELGLVDRLGDLDDAIAWAAQEAGIPRRTSVLRPKRPFLQMLMTRGADSMADAFLDRLQTRLAGDPADSILQARMPR